MTARGIGNGIAAMAALVLACGVMGLGRLSERQDLQPSAPEVLRFGTTAKGQRALLDITGRPVPLRGYSRIVAGSIVSRSVLGEICEKDRIVGVIDAGLDDAPDAHRFAGIATLRGMNETEQLLALKPDLLILSSLSSISHAQRLRDAGIEIFILGDMRGVTSFVRDVQQIAWLIGAEERGARLATGYARRMRRVADDIPQAKRKRGIYLSAYGTQMFGGTKGTSYHDVLVKGGLIDAAAENFAGWPQYNAEHLLSMDPPIIVSPVGIPKQICERGALERLAACQNHRAGFVELPASWLEDPSLVMLDVAESIREAVYGAP